MLANYPWLMWGIILGWTGLSIWLSNKTKLGRKLGYINLCIIGGFVLVNIKVVPQFCEQYSILSNYVRPNYTKIPADSADLQPKRAPLCRWTDCTFTSPATTVFRSFSE